MWYGSEEFNYHRANLLELKGRKLRIEYRNGGLNDKRQDQGVSNGK
jgi:hypothetical protein